MIALPKASHREIAPDTGLRRVTWVRIALDDGGAHCEVIGVGHRLPTTRRVSLDTALALAGAGVPTVLRSPDGSERLLPTA